MKEMTLAVATTAGVIGITLVLIALSQGQAISNDALLVLALAAVVLLPMIGSWAWLKLKQREEGS